MGSNCKQTLCLGWQLKSQLSSFSLVWLPEVCLVHVRSTRDLGPVYKEILKLLVSGSLLSRIPSSLPSTCGCLKLGPLVLWLSKEEGFSSHFSCLAWHRLKPVFRLEALKKMESYTEAHPIPFPSSICWLCSRICLFWMLFSIHEELFFYILSRVYMKW